MTIKGKGPSCDSRLFAKFRESNPRYCVDTALGDIIAVGLVVFLGGSGAAAQWLGRFFLLSCQSHMDCSLILVRMIIRGIVHGQSYHFRPAGQ